MKAAIVTWLVEDTPETASYFPQINARSDSQGAIAIYWRCVTCFFASSVCVNEGRRHILFTNVDGLPTVDGVDIGSVLSGWGVEIVNLPLSYRLHDGEVSRWGNQFYILDIIKRLASMSSIEAAVVLDCDCLWLSSADRIDAEIERCGLLTYVLGDDEHPSDEDINGLSRAGMGEFLHRIRPEFLGPVQYCGGEFFASRSIELAALALTIDEIWPAVLDGMGPRPREEAHFLSVIYAIHGYRLGTANPYIRRMWTTFKHNNLRSTDVELVLWHLPAEKKTGFADLFKAIGCGRELGPDLYGKVMGVPRRGLRKWFRDAGEKAAERAAAIRSAVSKRHGF